METKIITVTDFIRKAGFYSNLLPYLDRLILTREGRPFATLKSSPQEKNRELLSFLGIWKGTKLDHDSLWKRVLTRKNRKRLLRL